MIAGMKIGGIFLDNGNTRLDFDQNAVKAVRSANICLDQLNEDDGDSLYTNEYLPRHNPHTAVETANQARAKIHAEANGQIAH
jgi:hypothetical protein